MIDYESLFLVLLSLVAFSIAAILLKIKSDAFKDLIYTLVVIVVLFIIAILAMYYSKDLSF